MAAIRITEDVREWRAVVRNRSAAISCAGFINQLIGNPAGKISIKCPAEIVDGMLVFDYGQH